MTRINKLVAHFDRLLVTKPCSSQTAKIAIWNGELKVVADEANELFERSGGSPAAEALSSRVEAFIDR